MLWPCAPDCGRVTACTWECAGERIEVPPPRPKRKPSKSQQQSQPAVSGMHSCFAREAAGVTAVAGRQQLACSSAVWSLPAAARGPCSNDCSLSGLHSWLAKRWQCPWGGWRRGNCGSQHSSMAVIDQPVWLCPHHAARLWVDCVGSLLACVSACVPACCFHVQASPTDSPCKLSPHSCSSFHCRTHCWRRCHCSC